MATIASYGGGGRYRGTFVPLPKGKPLHHGGVHLDRCLQICCGRPTWTHATQLSLGRGLGFYSGSSHLIRTPSGTQSTSLWPCWHPIPSSLPCYHFIPTSPIPFCHLQCPYLPCGVHVTPPAGAGRLHLPTGAPVACYSVHFWSIFYDCSKEVAASRMSCCQLAHIGLGIYNRWVK